MLRGIINMGLFSERYGLKKRREVLQLSDMDLPLRTSIFNYLYTLLARKWWNKLPNGSRMMGHGYRIARKIWDTIWHQPIDEFLEDLFFARLKGYVLKAPWYDVYDLLEFIAAEEKLGLNEAEVNQILEREMSGYRFIDGKFVPISDATELAPIENALDLPEPFAGARKHIKNALEKLSQKPEPDLRNAIKEAISAVESAARIVTGKEKAVLSDALKVLEQKGKLHTALRKAWEHLYGYTSDEGGIRHAMLHEPDLDFALTKYMVVSCAAFVNLLSFRGAQGIGSRSLP